MNIIITGGASGLGKAITNVLAQNSHNLLITFNKSEDSAKAILKEYPRVKAIKCDFSKEDDLNSFINEIDNFDPDVLINNAYKKIYLEKHFHKTDAAIFQESFDVNLVPVIKITQKAISIFRKKKFGKIITILSSSIINKPPLGMALYVAEKNYLYSLSKSWAIENSKFSITSNSISPDFMHTDFHKGMDERVLQQIQESHPLKKLLTPKEVGEAVLFLVNSSQQTNGLNIILNAAKDVI